VGRAGSRNEGTIAASLRDETGMWSFVEQQRNTRPESPNLTFWQSASVSATNSPKSARNGRSAAMRAGFPNSFAGKALGKVSILRTILRPTGRTARAAAQPYAPQALATGTRDALGDYC